MAASGGRRARADRVIFGAAITGRRRLPLSSIRWSSVRETRGVERDTRRCSHCLSGNAPRAAAMYILLLP